MTLRLVAFAFIWEGAKKYKISFYLCAGPLRKRVNVTEGFHRLYLGPTQGTIFFFLPKIVLTLCITFSLIMILESEFF